MKFPQKPCLNGGNTTGTILAALAILVLSLPPAASAQQTAETGGDGAGPAQVADFPFVKSQVVFPAKPDVTIVDSRPAASGYDAGHIPGAISIPFDRFDQLAGLLPRDRKQLLLFYCEDAYCPSSGQAAMKAAQRGYSNTRIYAAGLADWLKNGGLTSVSAAHIDKLKRDMAPHVLIDSRPAATAAKGMIPGAINIPDSAFDKLVAKLPAGKGALLIFYCGGVDCPHSASSAEKARKLGYTNVRTYPEGYPEWTQLHGQAVSTASPAN